ncbi:cell division protein ZipA C-terminal FtsZ-binding domain-containing protein [Halomonas sp.]|uniref:cell division protein ZipA C-terminal FtsZ-binding domain-containing protein n=1 Tax=Halomonas sp. TaxID=1486246 RepID=UPI003567CAA8
MELREWLIILGLALVTLIVIDGFRRLQRQRGVPRLDQVGIDARDAQDKSRLDPEIDPEEAARQAEINWELPNGGARVVSPADFSSLQAKPKLERQEHPGPSRVLSAWKASTQPEGPAVGEGVGQNIRAHSKAAKSRDAASTSSLSAKQDADRPSLRPASSDQVEDRDTPNRPSPVTAQPSVTAQASDVQADPAPERREPRLSTLDDTTTAADPDPLRPSEPLVADPGDHDDFQDEDRYRLVDFDGMGNSLKSGSRRVGDSVQRFGASLQKTLAERRDNKRLKKQRRDQEKAEKAVKASAQRQRDDSEKASREADRRRLEAEAQTQSRHADRVDTTFSHNDSLDDARFDDLDAEMATQDASPADHSQNDVVRAHPVLEKALRHDVSAEHARHALSHSEEIIVISIMSREEEGFSGAVLLDLMLACGLRYSRDMGIFHRFETEDPESRLQFSMVNALKPGIFPIEAMDDFFTPGVTLLMPLPGASDTAAAFEAMVETAMVVVRNLGGELKDENLSVMTAQTVEFARQRVQEFERRNRLNRYQVN